MRAQLSIAALSATVLGILLWLVYFKSAPAGTPPSWAKNLPALNASLNATAALFLVAG